MAPRRTKWVPCVGAEGDDDVEARISKGKQRLEAAEKTKVEAEERQAVAKRERLAKDVEKNVKKAKKALAAAIKEEKATATKEGKGKGYVWKKTDPLKFPASKYTKGVFKVNNPFIQVIVGDDKMPPFNKFSMDLKTKASVRLAAMRECSKELCRSFSLYEDPTNEKKSIEFKSSLFRNLLKFTVPSHETLARLEGNQKLFESLTGQKRKRVDAALLNGLSEQGDLLMETGERLSGSINEDIKLHVESRPVDEDNSEEGLIFADKKVYVRQVNFVPESVEELVHTGDEKKLVLVAEEKFKNLESASYQGGKSAVAEIGTNLAKKYTNPVYVLSLGQKWKYAILHVRGMIGVKDGAIDPSSLPAFREQERMMGFATPLPGTTLNAMLKKGTDYYQKRYRDSPTSVYPNGDYPVGMYYVSDVWRTLPQDTISGCANADMHLLYEGLLRIIVGDRVIHWGPDEMSRVRKVRKFMSEEDLHLKVTSV